MSLVKDVLDNKMPVSELRDWITDFAALFDANLLSTDEYKKLFVDGNLQGFSEACPLMPEDKVREVIAKFWEHRFDYKFIFLPKELAEPAATIHGYKLGLQAGSLFNLRNKTQ